VIYDEGKEIKVFKKYCEYCVSDVGEELKEQIYLVRNKSFSLQLFCTNTPNTNRNMFYINHPISFVIIIIIIDYFLY
jgi:hypothetical protein